MRESLPLVSIVIPAYNAAAYLRQAIDSVLGQSYPHIELIVWDDGSSDATPEILASYPEGSFIRMRHANRGQAATLNRGWAMAKGEILAYLSADDLLLPHCVQEAVDRFLQDSSLVLVYGDYQLIDDRGVVIRDVQTDDWSYRQLVARLRVMPGPGAFFPRRVFEQVGGWNSEIRQIPDFAYWLNLGLHGRVLRIPRILAQYRVHPDSQTTAPAPAISRCEEYVRVMRDFFDKKDLPPSVVSWQDESMSFAHVMSARMHLRARRFSHAFRHIRQAWKRYPLIVLSVWAWRLLFNGLVSR